MKHKNIPFSPPDMSEDEINEVADTLRNGWITTGPKVKEFERQIAEFVGVNKAVCLNSQTACAEMGLRVKVMKLLFLLILIQQVHPLYVMLVPNLF